MKSFLSKNILLLALSLLVSGCLGPPPDPRRAEQLRGEAETFAAAKKIDEAAEILARAIDADPGAIPLYLRRGEFLERLGRPAEARKVYTAGLKKAPSDPLKAELAWRLALLEALQLDRPDRAGSLLRLLPEGPLRDDAEGVLALAAGEAEKAVVHFDAALKKAPPQEIAAAVYYHASLAYHRVGDTRNTFGTLFHAVNNAGHLGVIRGIESHWELLNAPKNPGNTSPR